MAAVSPRIARLLEGYRLVNRTLDQYTPDKHSFDPETFWRLLTKDEREAVLGVASGSISPQLANFVMENGLVRRGRSE